jgi:hypothetical protein
MKFRKSSEVLGNIVFYVNYILIAFGVFGVLVIILICKNLEREDTMNSS